MSRRRESGDTPEDKTCASCGRRFEWRRKWAASWDEVRYCSDACRRRKVTATDSGLEAAIVEALTRASSTTPREAAARVGGDTDDAMREPARRAARRLANAGRVVLVQRGRTVDPAEVRGEFEIRRPTR